MVQDGTHINSDMCSEGNASPLPAGEAGPLPELIRLYATIRAMHIPRGLTTEDIESLVGHVTDWCARDETAQLICKWAKASGAPLPLVLASTGTPGSHPLPECPIVFVVRARWFRRHQPPAAVMFDVCVQNELAGVAKPSTGWAMSVNIRDIVLHRIDPLLTPLLLRHGLFRDLALLVGSYCADPAQFIQSSFDAAFSHAGGWPRTLCMDRSSVNPGCL